MGMAGLPALGNNTAAMYQLDRCINLIFDAVLFHTVFCVNLT